MLSWMHHDVMDVSWCHGCIMMLVRSEHACYIDSWCSSCTMMQLMYHDALVVPWCHGCSMIELMHVICVGPCYVNDVVCCLLWTVLLCCTFSNFTNPYTVYIRFFHFFSGRIKNNIKCDTLLFFIVKINLMSQAYRDKRLESSYTL